MGFFEVVGNIFASILIGYLAFTNTLASGIEKLIPHASEGDIAQHEVKTIEHSEDEAPKDLGTSRSFIPKILLENAEFQRAAVLASDRADEYTFDGSLSLPESVKYALVNVYCQYRTRDYIRTTTGSGYFINQKGVILTNAHVAQFLLLEDSEDAEVDCVIRSGDPATPKYRAELLYISPTWIFENAELITDESPRGTGERDYALLYVSQALNNAPLPTRFPSIPFDTALLSRNIVGAPVMTAGYPAEALMRNGADAALTPVVASTTIGILYTFGSNYADIFSISESPVGEHGASGGPIVTADEREAIGLIVTKGDEETEGKNSLRALTLSYIDRTIIEETGFSLIENMQGDVAYRGAVFKQAMVPFLAGILEEVLDQGG